MNIPLIKQAVILAFFTIPLISNLNPTQIANNVMEKICEEKDEKADEFEPTSIERVNGELSPNQNKSKSKNNGLKIGIVGLLIPTVIVAAIFGTKKIRQQKNHVASIQKSTCEPLPITVKGEANNPSPNINPQDNPDCNLPEKLKNAVDSLFEKNDATELDELLEKDISRILNTKDDKSAQMIEACKTTLDQFLKSEGFIKKKQQLKAPLKGLGSSPTLTNHCDELIKMFVPEEKKDKIVWEKTLTDIERVLSPIPGWNFSVQNQFILKTYFLLVYYGVLAKTINPSEAKDFLKRIKNILSLNKKG